MGFKPEQMGSLTQFPTKNNVVSWRQEEITLAGNALKTIHFSDTTPNMFYVQNPNDVPVLTGITRTPNVNSYEFRVEPNNTMTFGRPVPTRTLYLLNPSNKEITITLFSIYDTFDINILKNTVVSGGGAGGGSFDGIITGFSNGVSLPSGTNNIGKVGISGALPKGSNNIGVVTFTNDMINMITEMSTAVVELKGANKQTVLDVFALERENVTSAVVVDYANEEVTPNYINYISNDGDNDMFVTLHFSDTKSRTFTLKNGDALSDIAVTVPKIEIAPKVAGNGISYRMLASLRG